MTPHVHVVVSRSFYAWVCCCSHDCLKPMSPEHPLVSTSTSMSVSHSHTTCETCLAGMTMTIPTSTPSALHPPSRRFYAKSLPTYQPMCLVQSHIWKKDHLRLIETCISGQHSALLLPGATSSDSAINTKQQCCVCIL